MGSSHAILPDRSARVQLPGFGLPLEQMPKWSRDEAKSERYPHAIADFYASDGVTVRERRMLEFINQISDKPEWERKVFDERVVSKWQAEGCVRTEELKDEILSEKMFDYCIAELRHKAEFYKKTGLMPVLDAEATILKSDTAISPGLKRLLIEHVKPLEDVPEKFKDWHPGSDNKVLDLLHPSLFPLVYGLSRVLPSGTVPLHSCSAYSGKGESATGPANENTAIHGRTISWGNDGSVKAWGNYQWLPSDIQFRETGPEIVSYINNLHHSNHAGLYKVLEQFVDRSLPLWSHALSWFHNRFRITSIGSSDEDYFMPEGLKYIRPSQEDDLENDDEELDSEDERERQERYAEELEYDQNYRAWKEANRLLIQPEPDDFAPKEVPVTKLQEKFAKSGIQVIFKLANIHLTPEKPNYDGGSWHIEGALNEHICATALYYYDQENVTESHLAFRQSVDTEDMVMRPLQNEYSSTEEYYGILNEEAAIQELGKVVTRENRLIAFPNVLQHSVQSFELVDPTKPGHRKLLAMFLVDPHIRVLSTANVPPQRRDWWAEEVRKLEPFSTLPREVFEHIIEEVQTFPISLENALEIREKLMEERGSMTEEINDQMEQNSFNFCEH